MLCMIIVLKDKSRLIISKAESFAASSEYV